MTEEELAKHDSKTLLQLLLSADARCDDLTAERDHAWAMVANADTQMGQSLADYLQAKADNTRLREALSILLEEYVSDVDPYRVAGFYRDPETEDCVVKARAALKGESND